MNLRLIVFGILAALAASPLQAAITRRPATGIKTASPTRQQFRLQQEQALFRRLKSLSPDQLRALQAKLPPAQLRKVAERLKFLKRQESEKLARRGVGADGPNMVLSGASSVRKSGSENSLDGKGGSAGSSSGSRRREAMEAMRRMMRVARRMMAARRRSPMSAIQGFRSFQGEAQGAMGAGCTYPIATENIMESFFAGSGGCRMGAAACYMKGQSCVDVGMSMMCCPLGYSSGTLRAFQRMKQMQNLIAQFS